MEHTVARWVNLVDAGTFHSYFILTSFSFLQLRSKVHIMSVIKSIAIMLILACCIHVNAEPWKIASDQNFPPYAYLENGQLKGIHVDIVKAVMAQSGVKYSITTFPWARVVRTTNEASVDFSFPWVGKPERFKKYLMVGPIHEGRTVFAVKKSSSITYNNLQDISGLTVGTVRDYSYSTEFDNATNFKKDNAAKDNINIIKKLTNGRVDLIIGDENVLAAEAKKLGVLSDIKFLPKAVKNALRYAAFPKQNNKQAETFRKGLDKIIKSGEHQKILDKHLKN